MSTELDIERILDHWLDEGPKTVAERVVEGALETVGRTDQPRGWRVLRWPGSPRLLPLASAAAIVVTLGVGLLVFSWLGDDRGPGLPPPSVNPTPSTTAAPSASGVATARPTPSPLPTATPLARPSGATVLRLGDDMRAGETYTTSEFTPAFTFRGLTGWRMPATTQNGLRAEGPGHAYFFGPGDLRANPYLVPAVSIIVPARVVSEGGLAAPAPADLVAWLRARTDLALDAPKPATVGGFSGTMLEGSVRAGASLGNNPAGAINMLCSSDSQGCSRSDANEVGVAPGERFRFVVLDVRGQAVLILMGSDATTWATDRPALEQFIQSIAFPNPAGG